MEPSTMSNSRLPSARVAACALLLAFAATPLAAQGTVLWESKISGLAGGFAGDLDGGDQFGKAVGPLGDLDGDGVDDLVVGAYRDDDGGTDRGAIWVLFMDRDGTVRDEQKISDLAGGFDGVLDDVDGFGIGLSLLGDLDGDGRPELAVGAPFDDDGGTDHGAIWIVSLNPDGTAFSETKISDTAGGLAATLDDFDYFGIALAALGDIDGDGVPDLAAGAVRDDDGGSNLGAVHVLFLAPDGSVKAEQKISSTAGGFTGALENGGQFGSSLALLGDHDGDGVPDLAVGAPLENGAGSDRGGLWLLLLAADGTVKGQHHIGDGIGGFGGTLADGDWFGTGVAGLGDLDGDGVGDLAVGAGFSDDGGVDAGAVWILFLAPDGSVKAEQKISGTAGGFGGTIPANSIFGWATAAIADVDGDGLPDLAVGSNRDDDGGVNQGAVWLMGLDPGPWTDLHGGTTGAGGTPHLAGAGPLKPGSELLLALSSAQPSAATLLWIALASAPFPKFGGTLHAVPPVVEIPLAAGGTGGIALEAPFPTGVPPGTELTFQFLCQDASVPPGLVLSNGLLGTVP
jgi:hypothetical protein